MTTFKSSHKKRNLSVVQLVIIQMSRSTTKPTKLHMHPAKTQISLGVAQSDQSSLCAQWVAMDPRILHVGSEDSDQTGWMPRLI